MENEGVRRRIFMRRAKKWGALLLAAAMTVGLVGCGGSSGTGCTGSSGSSASNTENGGDDDVYTVSMVILGNEQPDEQRIEDAMNEILMKEVGAKIDITCLSFGTFAQQLQLMMTGNEKLDLVPVMRTSANSYISSGQIIDVSDLIDEYGDNIVSKLGEDMAKASSCGGFVYGVPIEREYFLDTAIIMRKDLIDKYNIDTSKIHSLADCEEAFATIKENEPGMKILLGSKDAGLFGDINYGVDMMLDGYGVLENGGQATEVTNLYESKQFTDLVTTAHDFYEKGYVDKEILTSTDQASDVVKAGNGFSYISSWKPSIDSEQTMACGREMTAVRIMSCDAFDSSDLVSWLSWGIAQNSERPDIAMKVLNCLYDNEDLMNLLDWGQEGIDYEVIDEENGVIGYPDGVDDSNVGYHLTMYWELPMKYEHYIWEGYTREDMDAEREMNNTAMKSNAIGFMYDFSDLTNEITALNNVKNEYMPALTSGVADPETALAEFNQKLYDAGLQKVIDEKNRQFQEWFANKNAQ